MSQRRVFYMDHPEYIGIYSARARLKKTLAAVQAFSKASGVHLDEAWLRDQISRRGDPVEKPKSPRVKVSKRNVDAGRWSLEARATAWTPERRRKYAELLSKLSKQRWEDPAFKESMAEARREMWKDPTYRASMTESSRELWKDPDYRKRGLQILKSLWTPARRQKHSEFMVETNKKMWENPALRDDARKFANARWADPVKREHGLKALAIVRANRPSRKGISTGPHTDAQKKAAMKFTGPIEKSKEFTQPIDEVQKKLYKALLLLHIKPEDHGISFPRGGHSKKNTRHKLTETDVEALQFWKENWKEGGFMTSEEADRRGVDQEKANHRLKICRADMRAAERVVERCIKEGVLKGVENPWYSKAW